MVRITCICDRCGKVVSSERKLYRQIIVYSGTTESVFDIREGNEICSKCADDVRKHWNVRFALG